MLHLQFQSSHFTMPPKLHYGLSQLSLVFHRRYIEVTRAEMPLKSSKPRSNILSSRSHPGKADIIKLHFPRLCWELDYPWTCYLYGCSAASYQLLHIPKRSSGSSCAVRRIKYGMYIQSRIMSRCATQSNRKWREVKYLLARVLC